MNAIVSRPLSVLQDIFGNAAGRVAREVGFVQRCRKWQPGDFARTFCLFLIRYPKATLQQLADELKITASALCQRLAQGAAASPFLFALLQYGLERLGRAMLRPVMIPLLRRFNGVYLIDGTSLPLPAASAERFAGCGGGINADDPSAQAAVKIMLRPRLDTSQAVELLLDAARTPDIHMMRRLACLPPGALHIGDLGFFDTKYFAELNEQGVFYLSGLPARVSIRPKGGVWQELADWLDAQDPTVRDREGEMEVAQMSPVRMRFFARRCPPDEAARRKRKLLERMRRKGKPPKSALRVSSTTQSCMAYRP